jgi:hypothetical protein
MKAMNSALAHNSTVIQWIAILRKCLAGHAFGRNPEAQEFELREEWSLAPD